MVDERQSQAAPGSENGRFWLVDDPLFLEHRARGYHPERPERLLAARHAVELVEAKGLSFEKLSPRDATPEEITRVHLPAYWEQLEKADGLFAALDDDTFLSPESVKAALRAAGGGVAMVEALLADEGPNLGLALLRPPGHHARPDGGMGFCLVNNIAVAARAALARGVSRVAIVDWDVHHGNGTQDAFYKDPRVLFASLHQYPFYPGTGAAAETGAGEGTGFTVNVPLSQGATDATYARAFDEVVAPVLSEFAPELILVSAGFDAHARDPLAAMSLTGGAYLQMARRVLSIAKQSAKGRVGLFLEGGYDLEGLTESLVGALTGLSESPSRAIEEEPSRPAAKEAPVSQRHVLELDRARSSAREHWHL